MSRKPQATLLEVVMQTHKVILDVDNAMGMFGDVDDGLAIALALVSPEIELLGCTTRNIF